MTKINVHPKRLKWIAKRMLFTIVGIVFFMVVVAAVRLKQQLIVESDDVHIEIINNTQNHLFIRVKDVEDIIFSNFSHVIVGQPLEAIDFQAIEQKLEENVFIKNAEIYINALNQVFITVEQREPIIRVMSKSEPSFYIDDEANKVSVSKQYTARVPVLTGYVPVFNKTLINDHSVVWSRLFEMIQKLHNDLFWRSMIEQVDISKKGDVTLIPKVGEHQVVLGNLTLDLAERLDRLKLFYREGILIDGWRKYRSFDMTFDDQIVAIKN